MARQTVELPSKSFTSKQEAKNFFKEMLHRYRDGEEINADDSKILFELLQRHPDYKIGVGVLRFYRDMSPIHRTSCFHLQRTDGFTTDFSYLSCIDGYSSSIQQQFYEACRYAVSKELTSEKNKLFKDAGGVMTCSKTGELITVDDAEYRHTVPKFKDIVNDFVATYKITISDLLVTPSSDMQYVSKLTDANMEILFKEYHAKRAKLAMFKKYIR